jgi:hypothetical protein
VAQLARGHHDLPPVVTLVRHEIREDMRHVERKVAPGVGLDGGTFPEAMPSWSRASMPRSLC